MSSQLDAKETASKKEPVMSSNAPAKPETLEDVARLVERLQTKRDKLQGQLEEIQKQLDCASTTYELLGKNRLVSSAVVTPVDLHGKTQLDALVSIAEANGNRLVVRKARRILVRVGLIKTAKNASSIIFTAINRSGRFQREAPGIYKLVEQKKQSESESKVHGLERNANSATGSVASNGVKPKATVLFG